MGKSASKQHMAIVVVACLLAAQPVAASKLVAPSQAPEKFEPLPSSAKILAKTLPYSQEHIDWCIKHHSGYRASDNTYPYSRHFRRACSSPFYRARDTRLHS